MAITLDLNPAWTTGTASPMVSAAFSPVANSLIIVDACVDSSATTNNATITDSTGALTWNSIGTSQRGTSGGFVMSWWAYTTVAHTNMTVTVNWSTDNSTSQRPIKVTTYLGTKDTTAVESKVQASSNTNNLTVNITNTNDRCRIHGAASDWNANGLPTSTDDEVGFHVPNLISGVSVTKATNTSGTGTTVSLNFDSAGNSPAGWGYKIFEIVPAPSGAITVLVNQAVETNTVQTIIKKKVKTINQVTETGLTQAITAQKVKLVNQVMETNIAQTSTVRKTKLVTVNQAVESNLSQPITTRNLNVLNQVSDSNISHPVTRQKIKILNPAIETASAHSISLIKSRTINQVVEESSSQIIQKSKIYRIQQAVELNLAQTITIKGKLGQVRQFDSALAINKIKMYAINPALESNLARSLKVAHKRLVGIVTETNITYDFIKWKIKNVGLATNNNESRTIVRKLPEPLPEDINAYIISNEFTSKISRENITVSVGNESITVFVD